jgi:hypothetical protein
VEASGKRMLTPVIADNKNIADKQQHQGRKKNTSKIKNEAGTS